MAAAKKVAKATTKKPTVAKTVSKTPAPVVSVPLPEASTRGRARKLYKKTTKSIKDVDKKRLNTLPLAYAFRDKDHLPARVI